MEVWKRAISILLAVSLIVSACPVTAFAEETAASVGMSAEEPTGEATEGTTEAAAEDPTEGTTASPTEGSAEGTTESPTEGPAETSTEAPTEAPAEDTPATQGDEALASGSCGEDASWTLDQDYVLTISGTGPMADYYVEPEVPEDDLPADPREEAPWQSYAWQITAIVIEEGITSIGSYAFYDCVAVKDVYIPSSVTYMAKQAFGYADYNVFEEPISVHIPGSEVWCDIAFADEKANPLYRGGDLFIDGTPLTTLEIPQDVCHIYDFLFSGTQSLTEVTFHEFVYSIGFGAFQGCSSLTSMTWEGSAPEIYEDAFAGVTATMSYPAGDSSWDSLVGEDFGGDLTWESYSDGPVIIDGGVFGSLTWTLDDAGTLTIDGSGSMNSSSVSADYPWHDHRSKVKEVKLGEEITSIGTYAFRDMVQVKELVVPDSVTTIRYGAFYDMKGLEALTIPLMGKLGALFSGESVSAQDGWTKQGISYYNIPASLRTVTVTQCTGISSYAFQNCANLTRIDLNDGITSIGDYAFDGCTGLTEIRISDTVTSINQYAFHNCKKLTEITIPRDVTNISSYAFDGCVGMTELVLPEGLTNIGSYAFRGMSKVRSVVVPASVTYTGTGAFYGWDSLEKLTIPYVGNSATSNRRLGYLFSDQSASAQAGWTNQYGYYHNIPASLRTVTVTRDTAISSYAFQNCATLVQVGLNQGVSSIGSYAFQGCANLTEIILPDSLDAISSYAFDGCASLREVTIPQKTTTIGEHAFQNCATLTEVVIPAQVTAIGSYAFRGCTGVTRLSLPEGLATIGSYAFRGMKKMTSLVVPDSVTYIGAGAFYGWDSLVEMTIPYVGVSLSKSRRLGFLFSESSNAAQSGWTNQYGYYYNIPSSLRTVTVTRDTAISGYAFQNCANLTQIQLNDEISTVGGYAFQNCASLTGLTIPQAVTRINSYAFDGCASLTEVVIPQDVTAIDEYAFRNCSAVTRVSLPEGLKSISIYAFQGMDKVTSLVVPDSVTYIGIGALSGWASLQDLTIPYVGSSATGNRRLGYLFSDQSSSVQAGWTYQYGHYHNIPASLRTVTVTKDTAIPSYAFQNCAKLTEVRLESSIASIGSYAFQNCTSLTTAFDLDSVTTINSHAFENCPLIPSFTLPKSLTTIGASAFQGCTGLTRLDLPVGLTTIGEYAFQGCSAVASLSLPQGLTTIGNYAFRDMSKLTSIVVPDSVTYTGIGAFNGCTSLQDLTIPYVGSSSSGNRRLGYLFSDASSTAQEDWTSQYGYYYNIPSSLRTVTVTRDTSIPGYSFQNCGNLTKIILNDGIASIGSYAFENCTGLTQLPNLVNVTAIPAHAFSGCSGLASLALPSGLTSIGEYAFRGADQVTEVTIPYGVTSLSTCAFPTSLTKVTFQGGAPSSISSSAFDGVKAEVFYPLSNTSWTAAKQKDYGGSLTWTGYEEDANAVYSGVCGGDVRWTLENGVLTISGTGPMTVYKSYNAVPWYQHRSRITSVVMAEGITTIAPYAFYGCSKLTSVTIPQGITEIPQHAFNGCSSLTELPIPERITTIGDYAFSSCNGLIELTIPETVTSIGRSAFSFCNSLTKVTIPGSVTTIRDSAFYGCKSLVSVTISEGVTTLLNMAFSNCTALKEVNLPETLTSIQSYAFRQCTSLEEIVLPDSVTHITARAFEDCSSLRQVTLPSGWTTVLDYVYNSTEYGYSRYRESPFVDCRSLTSIVIPEGLGTIPAYAFYNAKYLKEIHISKDLVLVDQYAFSDCSSLTAVHIYDLEAWCNVVLYSTPLSQAKNLYLNGELLTKLVIPETVTAIKSGFSNAVCLEEVTFHAGMTSIGGFSGCTGLSEIVIPEGVTSISSSAFSRCTGLTEITIPSSVTQIGSYAFSKCSALTEITIPEGVTNIGSYAFSQCTGLRKVMLPASMTKINGYAFYQCSGLTEVNLPDTLTSIYSYTFADCTSLEKIVIPDSVTQIEQYAFQNCTSLTDVTLSKNWKSTSYPGPFSGCTGLTTITIPEGATTIPANAFQYCTALQSITIPKTVTSINGGAFYGCVSLTEVTIPESVTSIDSSVFSGCTGLTEITIPSSVTTIGANAFYGCTGLTAVTIPESVASLNTQAFRDCTGLEQVTFQGDAPSITSDAFYNVNATMYYPDNNNSWDSIVGNNYGGTLTWESYDKDLVVIAGGTCGEALTWELNAIGHLTITGTGPMTNFASASAQPWSAYRSRITRVSIGEGVTTIGSYAFRGCPILAEAEIADTVTSIGKYAFHDCAQLAALTLPAQLNAIGEYAFAYCEALTALAIPAGVTAIPNHTFSHCTSLKTITLHDGIDSIGSYAFYCCYQLAEVTLPENLTDLGSGAFSFCTALTAADIPAGVTAIRDNTFQGCIQLAQVTLPDTLTSLGSYAFGGCSALTGITIPSGVTSLPNYVFTGCTSLTEVTIPQGVTSIGQGSFYGCTALKTVTIPGTVKTVGTNAFQDCTGLTKVQISDLTAWMSIRFADPTANPLYYAKTFYLDDNLASDLVIQAEVTEIAPYVFYNAACLEVISFLGNAPAIADTAFHGVTAIIYYPDTITWTDVAGKDYGGTLIWESYAVGPTVVDEGTCGETLTWTLLSDGLLTISGTGAMTGYSSFVPPPWRKYQQSITAVLVEDGVSTIGDHAFYGCTALAKLTLPDSLTAIRSYAFYKCASLEALTLSEGVTTLGDFAFYECGKLAEASLPESLTQIGDQTFAYCAALTGIAIGKNVIQIGSSAFSMCKGLQRVDIEDLTAWCNIAFDSQDANPLRYAGQLYLNGELVTELTIPEGVVDIGNYAFSGADSLTDITFPASMRYVYSYAFAGCKGLTSLDIPAGVMDLSEYAFAGCTGITDITFRGRKPNLGSNVFQAITATARYPQNYISWNGISGGFGGTITWESFECEVEAVAGGTCGQGVTWSLLGDGLLTISGTGAMYDYAASYTPWDYYYGQEIRAVIVEEGVTKIGEEAFRGCTSLKEVTIPSTLTRISEDAFQHCSSLKRVNISDLAAWCGIYFECYYLTPYEPMANPLYYARNLYLNGELVTDLVIPEGVTVIDKYAFYNASCVTTLDIPAGITEIRERAFQGTSLNAITFHGTAPRYINPYAFANVTATAWYPSGDSSWDSAISSVSGANITWVPLVSLGTVSGLKASGIFSHSIELSWNAVTEEPVTGYRICRDGVTLETTQEASFLDRNLTTGRSYTYQVYARFEDGTESRAAQLTAAPAEPTISILTQDQLLDQEESILTAQVPNRGNLGSLDGRTTTVQVWQAADSGDVLLGQAEQTALTEEAGTYEFRWHTGDLPEDTYRIKFVVTDPEGGTGSASRDYVINRTLPQKLTGVLAIGAPEGIHLNWNISWEALTNTYIIYRRTQAEEAFTAVATIHDRNQLTWLDTDVDEESLYTYYVAGVDDYGRQGEASDQVSATRAPDQELPQITGMTPATGQTVKGTLTFRVTATDNVAPISILLEYSYDQTAWTSFQEPVNGVFTGSLDTRELADGRLYVRATAYDAAGNDSAAWRSVYLVDNTGPAPLQGLDYSATSVTATLYWDEPLEEDVAYFLVERRIGEGRYTTVSTVRDTLGCNITGLTPGMTYVYRVTAYDQIGNRGVPTEDLAVITAADTLAPVVTRLRPAPGCYNALIPVTAQVTDESGVASITLQTSRDTLAWKDEIIREYLTPGKTTTLSHELDVSGVAEGALYVRAIARDTAGNQSLSDSTAPYVQYIVDRTAPAAPENLAVSGANDRMELTWTQGSETDLRYYSIYRSETADGPWEAIATGLQTLGYVDRTARDETTYFYKLEVDDNAGNRSAFSQTVSGQVVRDQLKPEVHSIRPVDGGVVSPSACTVSVLASDNRALSTIVLQYSLDGQTWQPLGQGTNLNATGDTYAAALPVEQLSHGSVIQVRAYAQDATGNRSEITQVSYTLDRSAPSVLEASAALSQENQGIAITWKDGGEEDLAGFRIYRKIGASGVYTKIASRTVSDAGSYTVIDQYRPAETTVFYYRIEAVDAWNNCAYTIASLTVEPEVIEELTRDTIAPQAVITSETKMRTGVEYVIDGSQSQDNVGIVSYEFSLDGQVLSARQSFVHKFTAAGTYTITLKVRDEAGNEGQTSRTITVADQMATAAVTIQVVDQYGEAVANAPVYFDLGQENQVVRRTDMSGFVTFTSTAGKHTVGAFISDNEWLPVQRELVVAANMHTTAQLTMVRQQLIEGDFQVERMTFEEIVAAGIDVTKPENQHIIRVNITAQYASGIAATNMVYNPNTGKFLNDSEPMRVEIPNEDGTTTVCEWIPIPIRPEPGLNTEGGSNSGTSGGNTGDNSGSADFELLPAIAILEIPVEARYLKEFFNVRLHILNNASKDFSMLDNVVTLNVPYGMTLMQEGGPARVEIAEIPGQGQQTVGWILRGDKAGDYDLSADYTGTMSLFNQQVNVTFETEDPIHVYGLDAVELVAELNSTIRYDAFYFNLSLENTSDIDLYMPSVNVVNDILNTYIQDNPEENWNPEAVLLATTLSNSTGYSQAIASDAEVTTLAPGEKLTRRYAVYDVVNADQYNNQTLYFKKAVSEIAEGYGVSFKITMMEMELYSTEDALDKIQRVHGTPEAEEGFDFVLQDGNFIYVKEANDRDTIGYLTGEILYSTGQAVFNFDLGYNTDETQLITRQTVVRLLEDDSTQDAVSSNIDAFYLDTAKEILELAGDILEKETQDDELVQAVSDMIDNDEELNGYAAALKKKGMNGLWDSLLDALASKSVEGLTEEALKGLILDKCTKKQKELMKAKCEDLSTALDLIEKGVEAWNTSAEMCEQLVTIASANQEATLLLDMLIQNLKENSAASGEPKYRTVLNELRHIRDDLEKGYDAQVDYFVEEVMKGGLEVGVEAAAMKALEVVFGVKGGVIHKLLKTIFNGMDEVFEFGESIEFMHTLQVGTLMSRAMGFAVVERGKIPETQTDAVYQLKALKYLIKLRLICENYYTDTKRGDPEALDYLNSVSEEPYTSMVDYSNYITRLLLGYRDQIYSPISGDATVPQAPAVTLDYQNSATVESFTSAYEYSFNGSDWQTCDGGPIQVTPGTVAQRLRVRVKGTGENLTGLTAYLSIPAMPVLLGDVQVLWQGNSYHISGLANGWYDYQLTDDSTAAFEKTGSFLSINGQVTLRQSQEYVYLALRTQATSESFASRVRYLEVHDPMDDWVIVEETDRSHGQPGSSAQSVIEWFQSQHEAQLVEIRDHKGDEVMGEALVGTGYHLILDDTTYIVVIRGDIDGDASVTKNDYDRMLDHLTGDPLTGAYLEAGYISNDDELDIFDIFSVLDYVNTGSFDR